MKMLEPCSETAVDLAGDAFGHASENLRLVLAWPRRLLWLSDANIGLARPRGSSLGGVIRATVPLNGGEAGRRKADIAAKSVSARGPQIEIRADVAASAPDKREQRQCHDGTL
jgi:hypothetical protein